MKVFWGLSASLAYKRHFPAIDWLQQLFAVRRTGWRSWFSDNVAPDWDELRAAGHAATLQEEAELNEIVQLVGMDALSWKDRLTHGSRAHASARTTCIRMRFDEVDTYTSLAKAVCHAPADSWHSTKRASRRWTRVRISTT